VFRRLRKALRSAAALALAIVATVVMMLSGRNPRR
jgi:hypothetical protein